MSGVIALAFPFQSEMAAFLSGLVPGSSRSAMGALTAAGEPAVAGDLAVIRSLPLKALRTLLPLREEAVGGFRTWTLASHPAWRLMVSGQGKVETALACQTLHHALAPSAYLLLGSACALDPALRPGDLVLADPGLEADFQPDASPPRFPARQPLPVAARQPLPPADWPPLSPVDQRSLPLATQSNPAETTARPRVHAGAILSADRNIFDPDEKQKLFATHHAMAFAWEGAGFHRFLRRNHALGWELRLITETASEPRLPLTTLQSRMAQGFPAVYPILEALGSQPPETP